MNAGKPDSITVVRRYGEEKREIVLLKLLKLYLGERETQSLYKAGGRQQHKAEEQQAHRPGGQLHKHGGDGGGQ